MVKKYLQKTSIVLSLSRINKVYAGGKKPPRTMEQQNDHQQYAPPPTSQNNNISLVDFGKLFFGFVSATCSSLAVVYTYNRPPQPTPQSTPPQVQLETIKSYVTASDCLRIAKDSHETREKLIDGINENPADTENLKHKLNTQHQVLNSISTDYTQMYLACLNASAQPR